MTEPYNHDEDDELPTLQRVAPTSSSIAAAAPALDAFPDEATTATDLDVLGSHAEAVLEELAPIADARAFEDIDTQKMPVEVRADLLRASQAES